MGLIAKLLSFTRVDVEGTPTSDAKVDPGSGATLTAKHLSAPGDDAHPLDGDYVFVESDRRTGGVSAVGYVDPINEPTSKPGEKIIYSRDPDSGETIAWASLFNDGTVLVGNENGTFEITPEGEFSHVNDGVSVRAKVNGAFDVVNDVGYFKLLENGTFEVNGVTIDAQSRIVTPESVEAGSIIASSIIGGGKELVEHVHKAANPPSDTGPNL